ncbi:hypothetical protein L873DRAFT_1809256 [Choiromyces venosus 120613-1]|uniref:Aminoglycoside phosphotransferase domain-containing protein n=1 Tax=Choiromyces venosus 120613-1 TaxID=1336337 RepID=A0A3N4JHQ5_9PEZI|nr:hypothetical protein L873DRAFT_1809256 [Choiromyces venosus 120613-1]
MSGASLDQFPTRHGPPQVHPLKLYPEATRVYSREGGTREIYDLGNGHLYKFRPHRHGVFESSIHDLIRSTTNIPIPTIYHEWVTTEGSDTHGWGGVCVHHIIMENIQGEALHNAWPHLNSRDGERLVRQFGDYLNELRRITSPSVRSVNGGPLHDDQRILFDRGYIAPGPLSDEGSLWLAMTRHVRHSPSDTVQQALINLRAVMIDCLPAVLTHIDLRTSNILVRDGSIVGVVGWEHAAFYPCWMEYVKIWYMGNEAEHPFVVSVVNRMPAYPAARGLMSILAALRSTNPLMVEWAIQQLII